MGGLGHILRLWIVLALAAIAQSLYAGTLDGSAPDESDTAAYAAWQAQVADQAQLIGASVGYITSAGRASNVSNGGSIAQSGIVNNFLSHLETIEKVAAEEALAECAEALLCTEGEIRQLRAEVLQWTLLDEARDLQIQQLCAQGNALGCIGVYNELGEILAEDLAFYNTLDPDSALARAVYAEGSGNDQLRNRLLELGGQAGARNTQITLNGFGFGAAGGAGAAVIVFGGPAALRCAADYTCRTNLALGLADELAMTPGAFTGTIAVTGTTVKVAGDVIGTLDDAKGFVRATNNAVVRGLDDVPDGLATPSTVRNDLDDFIKGIDPDRPVSVATAEVTVNGETQRFVSVSGNSWKADAPDTVIIDGNTYNVIRTDTGSVAPDVTVANANHAEQKLFSHIQDNFAGQNAQVNVAVENTSLSNPGMCAGCSTTSQTFAGNNPDFSVNIFEGSTGVNP